MSVPVLRLFLVRHGEAASNLEMRYLGSRDEPLTEWGTWQAAQLAKSLAVLPIAAIYASPLRRAADTAHAIARPHAVPVTSDERLREGAFGAWEGLTRAEVFERGGEDAKLLVEWERDPDCAPPGGESLSAVQRQVLAFVQELAGRHAHESVVLVSHVGPIKALLCAALRVPLDTAQRLFLDTATISVVDWSDRPVMRLFNAHHHLGWEAARWMGPSRRGVPGG